MPLPSVLVPGLDLRVGEVEGGCQLHAVLDAQVLLALEAALQLRQLMVREGRPGLSGLLEPDLRAVPTAGDLPVSLLFYCRTDTSRDKQRTERCKNRAMASDITLPVFVRTYNPSTQRT